MSNVNISNVGIAKQRMFPRSTTGATLLTGASGYLGSLIAATLLAEERRHLVVPLRATTDPVRCLMRIRLALRNYGVSEQAIDDLIQRVMVVELPPMNQLHSLDRVASLSGIDEVVHCAGCLDYYDKRSLRLANVEFTEKLLISARRWDVRRFLYLSTAYCAGYRAGAIPELLHSDPAPEDEPTEYTRSKRLAEWRIADSGVPFVIVRPSVVIGDSRNGRYTGHNYGLYQMWRAIEGLLCREYSPVWYTVAPSIPVNLVHQDAFQEAFVALYQRIAPNTLIHLVSDHDKSPSMRDLCWLWAGIYSPAEIHCYAKVDDVPLHTIPMRQRRFLEIAWKNLEIATHTWRFETKQMDKLRTTGLSFTDATLESVARCQQSYIDGSAKIKEYMRQYADQVGNKPRLIDFGGLP